MDGREHYGFVVASSLLPLLGVVAAVALLWQRAVGPSDLVAFAVMYLVAGIGVSAGYHRLLAHRSFRTGRGVRIALAAAGAMAGQGPPLVWVAHHRRHHTPRAAPARPRAACSPRARSPGSLGCSPS
ncbi:hypothetical protein RKE29_12245 [Streptomyces sp. B1866]|uniref:hypothetical protein n=1 Tax=Streptomyces sp. B1866 TaxID=3075431 RepID=UPI002890F888|nr:hypothetical protein [Streptomyces sp. B1866]MDT3397409.1 hypothetical protein [Streptomyces sp. B1866]